MFLVVVVVELELEVFVGVDIRMQLPLMELNDLLKEKNYLYQNKNKPRLFNFSNTYKKLLHIEDS